MLRAERLGHTQVSYHKTKVWQLKIGVARGCGVARLPGGLRGPAKRARGAYMLLNRYPTPGSVRMNRGELGSGSSFWRSRQMYQRTVLGLASLSYDQTAL